MEIQNKTSLIELLFWPKALKFSLAVEKDSNLYKGRLGFNARATCSNLQTQMLGSYAKKKDCQTKA